MNPLVVRGGGSQRIAADSWVLQTLVWLKGSVQQFFGWLHSSWCKNCREKLCKKYEKCVEKKTKCVNSKIIFSHKPKRGLKKLFSGSSCIKNYAMSKIIFLTDILIKGTYTSATLLSYISWLSYITYISYISYTKL